MAEGFQRTGKEGGYRRSMKKLLDLPDGNMMVVFPKILNEMMAISLYFGTDSIKEAISKGQGLCLAEGLKPDWTKWTDADARRVANEKGMRERGARLAETRQRRKEERAKLAADFPERVNIARKRFGDY